MFRPPSNKLRLVAGSIPPAAAAGLADAPNVRCLKDHSKGTVWLFQTDDNAFVFKCGPIRTLKRRIQTLFRATPAWRHWHAARTLQSRGILTAPTLTILHGNDRRGLRIECLILGFVPGGTLLDHLAAEDLTPRQEHRAAEAVATLVGRLTDHNLRFRDAKPSNLILTDAHSSPATLAMIDCADLRRRRSTRESAVAEMLTAAYLEPSGCDIPPRRTLCARAIHTAARHLRPDNPRAAARALWHETAARVRAHGSATPADNPLTTPEQPGA